jgi:6-phosphogluconate dehydrogenase
MGGNMVLRLVRAGHECVALDRKPETVKAFAAQGAIGADSIEDLVKKLKPPRHIWLMIAAAAVDDMIAKIAPLCDPGDTIIDGGNSYYIDDIRRAKELEAKGLHYCDVGTSGGVWGLERGYCLMIGGPDEVVKRMDPIYSALAPGQGDVASAPGRDGKKSTAEKGYLHCGPAGGGHFVKMVHNGIEYGIMSAYAEGFNILKHAGAGREQREVDAETTPLRNPELYQYDFDLADIAELWRRGSVVASWLLDLTASALAKSPGLENFGGRVSDSGEGRWTLLAAIDESVPAPVLSASLYSRFASRGEDDFANKLTSAMRFEFGGHHEKPATAK